MLVVAAAVVGRHDLHEKEKQFHSKGHKILSKLGNEPKGLFARLLAGSIATVCATMTGSSTVLITYLHWQTVAHCHPLWHALYNCPDNNNLITSKVSPAGHSRVRSSFSQTMARSEKSGMFSEEKHCFVISYTILNQVEPCTYFLASVVHGEDLVDAPARVAKLPVAGDQIALLEAVAPGIKTIAVHSWQNIKLTDLF